jgi:hypothetical protein
MQTMRARFVVLLLLLYLSADFANPLMPGAVQFLDGYLSVVKADRVRPESPPVDAALIHHRAPEPADLALVPETVFRYPPLVRERRPRLVFARRALHLPPDSTSSSEDH